MDPFPPPPAPTLPGEPPPPLQFPHPPPRLRPLTDPPWLGPIPMDPTPHRRSPRPSRGLPSASASHFPVPSPAPSLRPCRCTSGVPQRSLGAAPGRSLGTTVHQRRIKPRAGGDGAAQGYEGTRGD